MGPCFLYWVDSVSLSTSDFFCCLELSAWSVITLLTYSMSFCSKVSGIKEQADLGQLMLTWSDLQWRKTS